MKESGQETIFALSSGGLPSGVAVVRVSGSGAKDALRLLTGRIPEPRRATLSAISNLSGEVLDNGLTLFFEAPRSFTGEDCAEFQIHGGRAVVKAVLDALGSLDGFRAASAGEFTRRAFENGRLDLVEVEGLADLVRAETEMQRKLARYLAEGNLSRVYDGWMRRLSRCRALIEAEFDFSDEGDVPGSVSEEVWREVLAIRQEMANAAADRSAEVIRDGFRVAIAGKPNAGKSSLLNYLAKRDVAIVTEIAGTTRDVLVADLDIEGYLVSFYDTAGLRETDDVVEKHGIAKARNVIGSADLVLFLYEDDDGLDAFSEFLGGISAPVISVRTKRDLHPEHRTGDIEISVKTGTGIDSVLKRISAAARDAASSDLGWAISSRHRNNISGALEAVTKAVDDYDAPLEIRAEHLRIASDYLGRITGAVRVEELLGIIFSEFCIGK